MKNVIKYLRESRNYSQSQLAEVLAISRQAYIKYESGEVEPPVSIVRKLSKLYSVTYEDLIDDKVPEEISYADRIHDYSAKVAEPAYNRTYRNYSDSSSQASSLVSQLSYIKMLLAGFEAQLKREKKMAAADITELKPRLNIKEFLAAVKPVKIDGSFVEELRSYSAERESE